MNIFKPSTPVTPVPETWLETHAQTAISTQQMREVADESAPEQQDIGRQVSLNERELFVSCEPALALQQQLDHLNPEYIAVHDIGTANSRKLLAGVAAASGRAMQKLIIRRQGYGTALATLEFIELPTTGGKLLRVYTTEVDAEGASRRDLARVLLAYSRLGAVMIGDLPSHAIPEALNPLRNDIITGPWNNRILLLLPLVSASAVAAQGMDLARGTGVEVRTTPHVTRPADAWGYINATWSRLREQSQPTVAARLPAQSASPSSRAFVDSQPAPLAMRPMPTVAAIDTMGATPENVLDRYVRKLIELTGMVSCCVFDVASGRDLAHAGASPAAQDLAEHGAELLAAMTASSRALGMGFAMPDVAITLGSHHLLLRSVPRHAGLALHAVLDKSSANLMLARLQVQRMDELFDEVAPSTR